MIKNEISKYMFLQLGGCLVAEEEVGLLSVGYSFDETKKLFNTECMSNLNYTMKHSDIKIVLYESILWASLQRKIREMVFSGFLYPERVIGEVTHKSMVRASTVDDYMNQIPFILERGNCLKNWIEHFIEVELYKELDRQKVLDYKYLICSDGLELLAEQADKSVVIHKPYGFTKQIVKRVLLEFL